MTITQKLIDNGLVTFDSPNHSLIQDLTNCLLKCASPFSPVPIAFDTPLDLLHNYVSVDNLNSFRLHCISVLNNDSYASKLIFANFSSILQSILGTDIAIQKNIGLSIQYPDDASSLLPIHSDVISSDCSPYEFVLWIPLVNCFSTKSMFYLPFNYSDSISNYINIISMKNFNSTREFYNYVKDDLSFLSIKPPSAALFSHSLWHGNTINLEKETRVSLNIRVKNLFTPYKGKKLGDFFDIASLSPLSSFLLNLDSLTNEI
jgi:sporadic carbohydrate cluster 2OG-Fe(II) oxygenase